MTVQEVEAAALGERKAQVWREAKRGWKRCGELWGWCSPFIGAGGSTGEGWPGRLMPTLMALMPLKMAGLMKG
jgi:hypothetical protein